MERSIEVSEAWWICRNRSLKLEHLSIELSGGEGGHLEVHAMGTLKGKVTGVDPGDKEIEFQFVLDGIKYRIGQAQVFDVEHLPDGHSVIHLTGTLERLQE